MKEGQKKKQVTQPVRYKTLLNRIEVYISLLEEKGKNEKADTLFVLKRLIDPEILN